MSHIVSYVKRNKDVTFYEEPFNEVKAASLYGKGGGRCILH